MQLPVSATHISFDMPVECQQETTMRSSTGTAFYYPACLLLCIAYILLSHRVIYYLPVADTRNR